MSVKQPIQVQIEYKNFPFELKAVDEDQGIIEGYLSTFGNVDQGKDRVIKGAFKKTLMDAKSRMENKGKQCLLPVLWMHVPEQPLGKCLEASEDDHGLYVKFWLDITTNGQGIPNNPLATMVFSGYKNGYIDEQSMGYKTIQKEYDGQGVRNLKEVQLWELSCVTTLFAMNNEAIATSVKSASGGSFPLADRSTAWSKSKAIKAIEAATGGDWSKASKYFFWSASNPTTEADHKLPFVAKSGGTMKAIPQAIISAAAAVQGARGGVKDIDDIDAVKSKIAGYYSKMGMSPPWSGDKGKNNMPAELQTKDFSTYFQAQQLSDWRYKFSSLTSALRQAIDDAFGDGDQDSDINADVMEALNGDDDNPGFIHALMDWIGEGVALGYQPSSSGYGYMTRSGNLDMKAGAVVSQANADRLQGHVDTLMQVKDMIHSVAEDVTRYITGNDAYVPDGNDADQTTPNRGTEAGKTARLEPFYKALKANQPPTTSTDEGLEQLERWLQSQISRGPNDAA